MKEDRITKALDDLDTLITEAQVSGNKERERSLRSFQNGMCYTLGCLALEKRNKGLINGRKKLPLSKERRTE